MKMILLLLLCLASEAHGISSSGFIQYGLVVDAGSSGSRIRVFTWPLSTVSGPPVFTEISNYKARPGISSYVDNLDGLSDHLEGLINHAENEVPSHLHDETPIYLMATAGMRLLLETNANAVLDRIQSLLSNSTLNPFYFRPHQARVLSGEEEGAFAWIAVNYLRGFFNPNSGVTDHVGILELGGASTQIAFLPGGAVLAGKFPVEIGEENYDLYVHSYLNYGQDAAQRWVMNYLATEHPQDTTIDNPCMVLDDEMTNSQGGRQVTFKGIGNGTLCEEILQEYVYKVPLSRCYPRPCAVGQVYQPSIPREMDFYAVSAFTIYPTALNVLEDDGEFNMDVLTEAAKHYCGLNKTSAMALSGEKDEFVSMECIIGVYMPILFTKGYGFSRDTESILAVKSINGHKADWTLGAILYEQQKRQQAAPVNCPSPQRSDSSSLNIPSLSLIILILSYLSIYLS